MKLTNLTPESQCLQELGTRLAHIRKQQGYSQASLATAAGLGIATLRRIESGQDGQISSWLKLLRALGMANALDTLLPEDFRSPMAEVRATRKRRRNVVREAGAPIWNDEADTA